MLKNIPKSLFPKVTTCKCTSRSYSKLRFDCDDSSEFIPENCRKFGTHTHFNDLRNIPASKAGNLSSTTFERSILNLRNRSTNKGTIQNQSKHFKKKLHLKPLGEKRFNQLDKTLSCLYFPKSSTLHQAPTRQFSVTYVKKSKHSSYSLTKSSKFVKMNQSSIQNQQNYDFLLILDFEATCDNKQKLRPQV